MTVLDKLVEFKKEVEVYKQTNIEVSNSKTTRPIKKQEVQKALSKIDFNPITLEEAKEIGQRWYINCTRICNLWNFLSHSKNLLVVDNYAISMISTNWYKCIKDENGKRIFSSTKLIHRTIEDMFALKMLKCIDTAYSVGNYSKTYLLSIPRIESLFSLEKLSKTYGKEKEKVMYVNDNDVVNVVVSNDNNDVVSKDMDDVCESIYEKLGLYKEIQSANNGLKSIYKYKATGWRPSANLCYIASKEKAEFHKTKHVTYREDIIRKDFGELNEWDRNASIYNLMVYLGKGEIRSNDRTEYDLYEHLKKGLLTLRSSPDLNSITYGKENKVIDKVIEVSNDNEDVVSNVNDEVSRNDVKLLMMTINFADFRQINSLLEDTINYLMSQDNRCKRKALKFYDRFVAICKFGGFFSLPLNGPEDYILLSKKIKDWLHDAKDLLQNFVGKDYKIGSKDIFLYEAKVNLHCQNLLKEKGFTCVSVYDGFYTNASEEEWWDCYKKSLIDLKTLIE